jgi:transcriptional regulator with XRE-family HTH domain
MDKTKPDSPLKRARLRRGMTLQEVSYATKIDTGQLSRIENGKTQSLTHATTLARFFHLSELDILYPFTETASSSAMIPQ